MRHLSYALTVALALTPFAWCATSQTPATSSAPEPAATVIQRAETLRAAGQLETAATLLKGYLADHQEDPDALTALAVVRIQQQQPEDAGPLLLKAIASSPNSVRANDTLGQLLSGERSFAEAMGRFETVLSVSKDDGPAALGERYAATQLALQARRQDNQNAALATLEHALEKIPNDPELLLDTGIQYEQMKRWRDAETRLQEVLAIQPGNLTALYALGSVEMYEDKLPQGEAHLRKYLKARPDDATAHFGLGKLLYRELRTQDAREEFETSIRLQPVQTESYYELGQIALDQQDGTDAKSYFELVLSRNPKHGGALTGMGILSYRAKHYADAEGYLEKAVNAAPDYQPAHYYYGLTLAKEKKAELSDKELKMAIQLGRDQEMAARSASTFSSPDHSKP